MHGFIHPYLLFILSVFALSIFTARIIFNRTTFPIWLLVQGIVPILGFMLCMYFLDPVVDRPKNPYGLLINKTEVSDLFPFVGWLKSLVGNNFGLRDGYTEGYAYPGFLFIFVPIIFATKKILSLRLTNLPVVELNSSLKSYFVASLFCLCLGMGLHIILTGELLLDMIPQLRQFRTLGRTSWIFYYVCFVFTAVLFYKLVTQLSPKWKYFLLGCASVFWLAEIYAYHTNLGEGIATYSSGDRLKNKTLIADLLQAKSKTANSFQAQFVLPSSTEGAEKLSFRDDWHSKQNAIPYAYQSGLPMTSIILSRTSIRNSLNILQLSSSPFVHKSALEDFANEKPLLLVIQKDRRSFFKDIIDKSTFINKNEDISLYELPLDSLRKEQTFREELMPEQGVVNEERIHFFDFEDGLEEGFLSSKALLVESESEVFNLEIVNRDTINFSLSLWYKIQANDTNVPHFNFQTYDAKDNLKFDGYFRDWDSNRVEVIGDWIRLIHSYPLTPNDKRIRLVAHGNKLILDRVLFKPDSIEVTIPCNEAGYVQVNHTIGRIK